jgi:conserved oligomeric Golgi complex subunit 8
MDDLVHELEAVLEDGAKGLLALARRVVEAQNEEAGSDAEEREKERNVIEALGEVYMKVFVPFVRKAMIEGVYGVKDYNSMGSGLEGVIREWEGWLDERNE